MTIKPYHTIRFHVAYVGHVDTYDRQTNRKNGTKTVDEPLASPRPEAIAFFDRRIGKHRARIYVPETADVWKAAVAKAARSFLPIAPFDLPSLIDIDWFFRPTEALEKACRLGLVPHCVRPDRDNLDKSTVDPLVECGLLYDDSAAAGGVIRKWYTCGSLAIAGNASYLPWPMGTIDPGGDQIDYRTEPGAIVRIRLFEWASLGLKKPDRYRKPEAIAR